MKDGDKGKKVFGRKGGLNKERPPASDLPFLVTPLVREPGQVLHSITIGPALHDRQLDKHRAKHGVVYCT
jgi:hypothetical protein